MAAVSHLVDVKELKMYFPVFLRKPTLRVQVLNR